MALFWLLAGVMATLAALILLLPWLRRIPSLGPLPTVAWPLVAGAAVALVAVVGLYLHWGRPDMARGAAAPAPVAAMPTSDAPTQATTTAKPAGAAAAAVAGPARGPQPGPVRRPTGAAPRCRAPP